MDPICLLLSATYVRRASNQLPSQTQCIPAPAPFFMLEVGVSHPSSLAQVSGDTWDVREEHNSCIGQRVVSVDTLRLTGSEIHYAFRLYIDRFDLIVSVDGALVRAV